MDYNKYQYKILCEDKAHYYFVHGWLVQRGAHRRRIACYGELPHGGSGKAFVGKQFDDAVQKVRRLSKRVATALVVVIDADDLSVHDVVKKLSCGADDPVFFVIPKWSIDTWARFLLDPDDIKALDETESCKDAIRKKAKFQDLGKRLARTNLAATRNIPNSLKFSFEMIRDKKESLQ